jgi:cytochrome c oxidase cbb3-type subunit 3
MRNRTFKFFGALALLLPALSLQAQEAAANPDQLKNLAGDYLLVLGGLIVLVTVAVLFRLSSMLLEMQKVQLLKEHGVEVMKEAKLFREPWWERMKKRWTKVVPVEKEKDIMFDHEYDGIYELDNSLPPWWVALFYISIGFAVVYMTYYHFSGVGESQHETFEREMVQAEEAVQAYLELQADQVDETNVELLTDEASLASGKSLFEGKGTCVTCHGYQMEGGIGPNLTDEYWLHGGDVKDIFRTIKYGVPEKGMISWKSQLRAKEMHELSSYILSLQGTNPPNAKEPQGERYQAEIETEEVPQDTSSSMGMAN